MRKFYPTAHRQSALIIINICSYKSTASFPVLSSTIIILFSCFLFPRLLLYTVCSANPDAKRLYDDLLSNYNKLVRPVVNVTDALTVRIKLKLSQLIDVVSAVVVGTSIK